MDHFINFIFTNHVNNNDDTFMYIFSSTTHPYVTQKLNKRNQVAETHASDVGKKKTIKHYTSYDIGMSLYILVKNQDDGLQIVEQILPYFQPEYNVTITPVAGFNYKQDVSVILGGISIDDQYEGDFTERRVLTYQLDFTMKMKLKILT